MIDSPPTERSFLQIKNITHHYGRKTALRSVSLEARRSEVLALLGPSGSGKSTLLSIVAGILKPTSGEMVLGGRNLLRLPPEERGLGMVFQDFALWPHMTVAQNVGFPLSARRRPSAEIALCAQQALKRVGLEGFENRRPHELSGGQQQRVALARAVIAETQLLLLDEPLSALDPATRSSVRGELAEVLRKLDLTTILVTHDREEAFELADRVAVLVDGEIQQYAEPEAVYERPANLSVARFMGINLLSVLANGNGCAELRGSPLCRLELPRHVAKGPAELAIVPEKTCVGDHGSAPGNLLPGHLIRAQYRGGEYRLQVRLGPVESGQIIEARAKNNPAGKKLFIHIPPESIHILRESPATVAQVAAGSPAASESVNNFQEELA